ncbi:MAG: ferrous iron transport protein B [Clostridiales bacterium]|nr:ferrous iron transport protein B [Clostridiales bacterium]
MINIYKYIKNKKPHKTNRPQSRETRLTVALCGNPNSGKTTLFNLLTGSNQKVGNWPGVTVEQKTGRYRHEPTVAIVDTPGIYSLTPFTPEEQVTQSYLLHDQPDVIINVIDATSLERSLFLTSQLIELDVPVIVALNMQDEAQAKGIKIDKKILEKQFGCKFLWISAAKNLGVKELTSYCLSENLPKAKRFSYDDTVETAIRNTKTPNDVNHRRFVAIQQLSDALQTNLAEQRYSNIRQIVGKARKIEQKSEKEKRIEQITNKIDSIVLNKWLAFPIFALVMALIFYLSIGSVGGFLTDLINDGLTPKMQEIAGNWLSRADAPWLNSLICDGIIAGVMSVVGFLPQIMMLFGLISILEASGYMSRIAFITDRLLRQIGLGGRSFVSMVLGCGCSVPAIMATRTIKNADERNATITLSPFMPCSAKLAIISFFSARVLHGKALLAVSFYFISIFAVILGGLLLKLIHRQKDDNADAFILELPPYRAPKLTNVFKQMWERGKAFLFKAGTIIFTASVLLWSLTNFNFRFEFCSAEKSMMAGIGKLIAPIFIPLGFNDMGYGWQFSVATLTGIAAKETVVTTLQILLPQGIDGAISALGAYSFVTYNLLTVPCVAAISASFTEQGNWKLGVKSALFQIVVAYIVSLVIYQTGRLATTHPTALIITLCVAAVALGLFFSIRYLIRHRGCTNCKKCNQNCVK